MGMKCQNRTEQEDKKGKGWKIRKISLLVMYTAILFYIVGEVSLSHSIGVTVYDPFKGGYVEDYANFTYIPSNFSFNLTLGTTLYNLTNITLNLSTSCFYNGYQYAERNESGMAQDKIEFYNYSEGGYNIFNWESGEDPIENYPILDNFTYTWGLFNFSFTSSLEEGVCSVNISVEDAYGFKESIVRHLNVDTLPPRLYINSTNAEEDVNTTNYLHVNVSYYDLFIDTLKMFVVFNGTNSSFIKGEVIYAVDNETEEGENNITYTPHAAYLYQEYGDEEKVNDTSMGYMDKGDEAWVVGYLHLSTDKKVYLIFNKSTHKLKDVTDYNTLSSLVSSLDYNSYFIPTKIVYNTKTGDFYEVNVTKRYNLSSLDDGPRLAFRRLLNSNYSVFLTVYDYFGNENETSLNFKINDSNDDALPIIFITSLSEGGVYLNGSVDIAYRPLDLYAYNITNCSLLVNGSVVHTNTTIYWNVTNHFYYLFKAENYRYNYTNLSIMCWNDLSRNYTTKNISVRFTAMPELSFINLSVSPLDYKKNDKIMFDIYIINNGTVTSNETNLTYCFSSTSSCTSSLNTTNFSIPSLRPGEYVEVKAYQNISSDGIFYAIFRIDENQSVKEYDEGNNALVREISTYLSVDILAVYNSTGGHDLYLSPGSLVNITINVSTYEGIPVEGIKKENISVYDWWKGNESVMQHANVERMGNPLAVYEKGDGIYNLTYKITDKIVYDASYNLYYYKYGYHFVNLSVMKNGRRGNSSSFIYREKAPYILLKMSVEDDGIAVGEYTYITLKAANVGNVVAKNLTVVLVSSDEDVLSFSSSSADDDRTCQYDSTLQPNGSYVSVCRVKVYGRETGEEKIYIKQNANSFYYWTSKVFLSPEALSPHEKITVINSSSSSSSSNSGSSSSSSTDDSSHQTQQQTTDDKKVYTYSLLLENNQTSFSFRRGDYKIVVLRFKNGGNGTLSDLNLSLSHPPALNVVVVSKVVNILPKKTGEVKLNVSSNVSGIYMLTLHIKNSKISKRYSFSFIVQPTENEIKEINRSYLYLKNEIESIKDKVDEGDKEKYLFFVDRLNDIKQLMDKGDYVNAKQRIEELNNSIQAFKKEMESRKSGISWKVIGIIVVSVGVLGGGLIYYLWTPPKMEYEPFKGYYYPSRGGDRDSLKRWLEKIKDKLKRRDEDKKEKFVYRYNYDYNE